MKKGFITVRCVEKIIISNVAMKKGSRKAISLRQQTQSGPKKPAWRC